LKTKFPNYDYNDIVDLQHKVVTEIMGIKHIHAILGMSMGGMNAWQWAEAYPDMMDGVMPVVSLGPQSPVAAYGDRRDPFRPGMEEWGLYGGATQLDRGVQYPANDDRQRIRSSARSAERPGGG
jgi:pimeloyl-ACP methyl ester carboxylesterase